MSHATIWTDGACHVHTDHRGGWAYVALIDKGGNKIIETNGYGSEENTTSNRMELKAVIKALEFVLDNKLEKDDITIFSDSKYTVRGCSNWIYLWQKNNYKNGTIKNRDLWEQIRELLKLVNAKFKWVKSHNGSKYNEKADELAVRASNKGENKKTSKVKSTKSQSEKKANKERTHSAYLHVKNILEHIEDIQPLDVQCIIEFSANAAANFLGKILSK